MKRRVVMLDKGSREIKMTVHRKSLVTVRRETKSLIKNGIKVTSRIPRHYRIRSRKRRPRSPTDDSERTDSAEEDATEKVSGIKGKKMPCMQEKVFTDRKGI